MGQQRVISFSSRRPQCINYCNICIPFFVWALAKHLGSQRTDCKASWPRTGQVISRLDAFGRNYTSVASCTRPLCTFPMCFRWHAKSLLIKVLIALTQWGVSDAVALRPHEMALRMPVLLDQTWIDHAWFVFMTTCRVFNISAIRLHGENSCKCGSLQWCKPKRGAKAASSESSSSTIGGFSNFSGKRWSPLVPPSP